ncbi:hypothetical protein ACIP4Q_20075 [Streptomyces massasporeus]
MHSTKKFARLAAVGIASAGLVVSANTSATAVGWPGAFAYTNHTATVRADKTTSSAKLDTIPGDEGRKCGVSDCRTHRGGSYTCWSGGPRGNTWVAVLHHGSRLGWVAAKCVTFQRFE